MNYNEAATALATRPARPESRSPSTWKRSGWPPYARPDGRPRPCSTPSTRAASSSRAVPSVVEQDIYALEERDFGATKHWHKRICRDWLKTIDALAEDLPLTEMLTGVQDEGVPLPELTGRAGKTGSSRQ